MNDPEMKQLFEALSGVLRKKEGDPLRVFVEHLLTVWEKDGEERSSKLAALAKEEGKMPDTESLDFKAGVTVTLAACREALKIIAEATKEKGKV